MIESVADNSVVNALVAVALFAWALYTIRSKSYANHPITKPVAWVVAIALGCTFIVLALIEIIIGIGMLAQNFE